MLTHAELVAPGRRRPRPTIAQIAGTIAAVDQRKSARGIRFAFVRLSDPTGIYEVAMFSECSRARATTSSAGRSVVLTVEADARGRTS